MKSVKLLPDARQQLWAPRLVSHIQVPCSFGQGSSCPCSLAAISCTDEIRGCGGCVSSQVPAPVGLPPKAEKYCRQGLLSSLLSHTRRHFFNSLTLISQHTYLPNQPRRHIKKENRAESARYPALVTFLILGLALNIVIALSPLLFHKNPNQPSFQQAIQASFNQVAGSSKEQTTRIIPHTRTMLSRP